jgi:hypothetical protein
MYVERPSARPSLFPPPTTIQINFLLQNETAWFGRQGTETRSERESLNVFTGTGTGTLLQQNKNEAIK